MCTYNHLEYLTTELTESISEFVYRSLVQITATEYNQSERKELASQSKQRMHYAIRDILINIPNLEG